MMRTLPRRDGFTLIELLIVVVIISILATIGVSVFWRVKGRGHEAAMRSDLRTLAAHQEKHFGSYFTYAAAPADLTGFAASPGVIISIDHADNQGWAGTSTHPTQPDRICGMFVGVVPPDPANPATEAGVLACGDR